MTDIRKKSLSKQVMARDLGICKCCGLEASKAIKQERGHYLPIENILM